SAGYMGSFTGNRKALLLAEDGGHVVSTPHYTKNENLQLTKINGIINNEGNLAVEVLTHSTGQKQETKHGMLYEITAKQREEYLMVSKQKLYPKIFRLKRNLVFIR